MSNHKIQGIQGIQGGYSGETKLEYFANDTPL